MEALNPMGREAFLGYYAGIIAERRAKAQLYAALHP